MSLYARLAGLPLVVEGFSLEGLVSTTGAGWTRRTTVVGLSGQGETGTGEDVTYQEPDQLHFQAHGRTLPMTGTFTLEGFSRHLDGLDLFLGVTPSDPASRHYRRWAFESAAADLALRQARAPLHEVLDRALMPLRFVASLGLGSPPSPAPLERLRERSPGLGFKVDFDLTWTRGLLEELAAFGGIAIVDLKGQYRGAFQGPPADVALYALVGEMLPSAWIEDPEWTDETAAALAPVADRVTWDAPFHAAADLDAFPNPLRAASIKPSRFGTWRELFAVYERCERSGIAMYGGGQFELGVGRDQIQYLAAMFHPDGPNDCAPREFNRAELTDGLPESPLALRPATLGFALSSA
jgi:hypothetical protein